MIKVLVVDDDKLVRKGLISAMPWQKFNMKVVGEANNGYNAMKFLSNNAVDLVLLDLSMPIMSGLELMRIIHQRYPHIFVVVLTMHKDFEYIQEALRLGAIDYIAKVQLEKERFEAVLSRIISCITERIRKDNRIISDESFKFIEQEIGYAILFMDKTHDDFLMSMNGSILATNVIEIDNNILLYVPDITDNIEEDIKGEVLTLLKGKEGSMIIEIIDLKNRNISTVKRVLRGYYKYKFFYEYGSKQGVITKSLDELDKTSHKISEMEQTYIENQWLSFNWINNIELFEELCNQLKHSYYPMEKLIRLLTLIEDTWNRLYSSLVSQRIELPERLDSWQTVKNWLDEICSLTNNALCKSKYSPEITRSIINAIKIIDDEMEKQLIAADIAKRVNMSRGYFNQCFKDITGKSFNSYLRFARFEKAKKYLSLTDEPIYSIAQMIGYNDEKYFSSIFRREFGLLPSEYRQNNAR